MRHIFSALAIAFILFIFTFNIDGEIGVILDAFLIFAPLISLFFAWYGRKRVNVSFDCDGFVKKGSKLTVNVTVEKSGFFPLGMIEIEMAESEVFSGTGKIYKLSLIGSDKKSFSYTVDANIGGNGEIAVASVKSCGFLGFIRFKSLSPLPMPVSVGVIPEIPKIKASSQLFRSIADSVLTSDDEESSDSAVLLSSNTSPGYEHREYVLGDPLKRVNWKLSVKKDKLMVRLDEAIASVQPVILLDLFRSSADKPENAILNEEQLIRTVFGLLYLLVNQGIAVTFVYYGANGELLSENVDNPDYPPQLLLKVLAVKVLNDRHIRLSETSACSCIVTSTSFDETLASAMSAIEDKDSVSLVGHASDCRNSTDLPIWYLDGDNNFKLV